MADLGRSKLSNCKPAKSNAITTDKNEVDKKSGDI